MNYHFRIKGVISPYGYWDDEFTPDLLQLELTAANGKNLFIDIDSVGGCMHTGLAMFATLRRYAEEHNATITTRTAGFVASIATAIFLAGDRRVVNEFAQPFIHEPYYEWAMAQNADEFKKLYEDLMQSKDLIAEFYSKNTNLTKDEALDLMANDTWLSANECLQIGFATEVEELSRNRAQLAARLKQTYSLKPINKMSKTKQTKTAWFERIANAITKQSPINELTLAGVDGKEIVFPNLEPEATPSVGDAVTVDGDANFTGEAETDTYVFGIADGALVSVVDKTEFDTEEVIDNLLSKNDELQEALNKVIAERDRFRKLLNSLGKDAELPTNGKEKKTEKEASDVEMAKNKIMDRLKNKK